MSNDEVIYEILDMINEAIEIDGCRNPNCESYGFIDYNNKALINAIRKRLCELNVKKLKDEIMIDEL